MVVFGQPAIRSRAFDEREIAFWRLHSAGEKLVVTVVLALGVPCIDWSGRERPHLKEQ